MLPQWLSRAGRREDGAGATATARRLVIGDIHGCSRTFRALLEEEMRVTPEDHIFLLGDLVSKGPDSIGVVRYVEELEARGVTVTIVRGNHEEAILRARDAGKGKLRGMLEQTQNTALLDDEKGKTLDPRWEQMFERSVYAVTLPDAILVHGGIDLTADDPFADGRGIVNARESTYDATVAEGRRVIHGHTRNALSTIIQRLVDDSPVIPLDNGAVGASSRKPFKVSEYGNLCCLNLDDLSLHVQPNQDVEYEAGKEAAFSLRVRAAGHDEVPADEADSDD